MELSSGARRVFNKLRYYARGSGVAFPFHKLLAKDCEIKEPTLRMYIAELRRGGFIESRKRQHSSAEYRLLKCLTRHRSDHRSDHRSEGFYPISEVNLETNPEGSVPKMPPQSSELIRTWDPNQFAAYIGVFGAYGKALNSSDVAAARALWCVLGLEDRIAAFEDIQKTAEASSNARYIPLPKNHLNSRAWTRRVAPGAIPMDKSARTTARALEIVRARRAARGVA